MTTNNAPNAPRGASNPSPTSVAADVFGLTKLPSAKILVSNEKWHAVRDCFLLSSCVRWFFLLNLPFAPVSDVRTSPWSHRAVWGAWFRMCQKQAAPRPCCWQGWNPHRMGAIVVGPFWSFFWGSWSLWRELHHFKWREESQLYKWEEAMLLDWFDLWLQSSSWNLAGNRKESLLTGFRFLNCYSDSESWIPFPIKN